MTKKSQAPLLNIIIGIIITALIFLFFYLTLDKLDLVRTSDILDAQYIDTADSFVPMLMMIEKVNYVKYLEISKNLGNHDSYLFGDFENYKTYMGDITAQDGKSFDVRYSLIHYYENNELKGYPSVALIRKADAGIIKNADNFYLTDPIQKRFKEILK